MTDAAEKRAALDLEAARRRVAAAAAASAAIDYSRASRAARAMIDAYSYVDNDCDDMLAEVASLREERAALAEALESARKVIADVEAALGDHDRLGTLAEDVRDVVAMHAMVSDQLDAVESAARRLLDERDEARRIVALLLDGHLSPRDDVRAAAIREAMAARATWDAPQSIADAGPMGGCFPPEEGDSIANAVRKAARDGGTHAHHGADGQVRGYVLAQDEALGDGGSDE